MTTKSPLGRRPDVAPLALVQRGITAPRPDESGAAGRHPVPLALRIGTLLDGKYELRHEIGSGGMGVVFAALDRRLDREVAIKIIHPRMARDPELRARLADEARYMAKLRHPNVMEIYDIGHTGECPYLVMPYCRGMNLREWALHSYGLPVSAHVAIGIIGQACAGVAALHDMGVVHFDIKPENILLSPTNGVVITDLGLAQRAETRGTSRELGGTSGFVAPEYLRSDAIPVEFAPKADVYALGVTTYWLLVGRMPTGEGDFHEIARRQLIGRIPRPSELDPSLGDAFDELLTRSMSRTPQHRPDVSEFREALFAAGADSTRDRRRGHHFIVIVDDDPDALELTKTVVQTTAPSAEIAATTDPRVALSIIGSRPPDLIVSDLQMPGLNGVELAASVRGQPNAKDIPIIVLTGVGGADDWSVLRKLGVERFLLKPLQADLLHDVVVRALEGPASPRSPRSPRRPEVAAGG